MTPEIVEHGTSASLVKMLDKIKEDDGSWGVAIIDRHYLRPVTKEAFLLSIGPVMDGVMEAHCYSPPNTSIYIVWRGKQKNTYLKLMRTVGTALLRPEFNIESSKFMVYRDPHVHSKEIRDALTAQNATSASVAEKSLFVGEEDDDTEEDESLAAEDSAIALKASPEQVRLFREAHNQKPQRKRLEFLVVEDETFAQKLLCEILRGVRLQNNNESPSIETAPSLREAWKLFLKKAPDITFIDLNLADGSGHTLARAIKEVDAGSRIVIVTSSNYQEEIEVARQNNVDFFIAKPYNKKQVLDCVASYVGLMKSKGGQSSRGKFS